MLSQLDPSIVLSQLQCDILPLLENFESLVGKKYIDNCISEFELLKLKTDWKCVKNPGDFCIEASHEEKADGVCRYHNIVQFAFAMLTLPFSNAAVEIVFSVMRL